MLPETVGADEFLLRAWSRRDAAVLDALVVENLEHLRPWMPWVVDEPLGLAGRELLVDQWQRARVAGDDAVYGIWAQGVAVGGCGLHRRIGDGGLEIGYWIAASEVRRHHASNAAALLVRAAFSLADVDHVEIHHDQANVASGGVPRRLGFTLVDRRAGGVGAAGETGTEWIWRLDRRPEISPTGR